MRRRLGPWQADGCLPLGSQTKRTCSARWGARPGMCRTTFRGAPRSRNNDLSAWTTTSQRAAGFSWRQSQRQHFVVIADCPASPGRRRLSEGGIDGLEQVPPSRRDGKPPPAAIRLFPKRQREPRQIAQSAHLHCQQSVHLPCILRVLSARRFINLLAWPYLLAVSWISPWGGSIGWRRHIEALRISKHTPIGSARFGPGSQHLCFPPARRPRWRAWAES